jgi:septal ring-binding cell division protein DamX
METVKKSGTLSEISCPRLLAHLHRARFDGTLRVSRGALLKLLYFKGGEIAMASSNDQADHLAPILIRAGKLKAEQMDLARKSTRPGVSLARVLVQMGFLTSGELFAGARQQLRQIVGSVMPLTDAGYEIQGGFFPREITSLNVDTRELLLDLIGDLTDRSFVLLEVGAPDTVYVPAAGGNGGDSAPLPRRWKDLVDRFGHRMAIQDFGQAAGLDDFSASKVVYGLSLLGRLAPEHLPEEEDPEQAATASETAAPGDAAEEPPLSPEPAAPDLYPPAPAPVMVVPIRSGDAEADAAAQERLTPSREEASGAIHTPEAPTPDPAPVAMVEPPREHEISTQASPPGARLDNVFSSPPVPAVEPAETRPRTEPVPSNKKIREDLNFPRPQSLPSREPSRPWTILSILSGLILLALVSYWFVFLRAPSTAGEATPSESSDASAAAGREATPPQASPLEDGAPPSAAPVESTPEQAAPDTAAVEPPPAEPPPIRGEAREEQQQPSDRPAAAPHAVAPTPAPPAGGGEIFSPAWSKARSQMDAGEHAAAAQSWSQALRGEASSFTLQIAIACQDESLRKAARGTRGTDPFFVTPFLLQGRPCYRLCYGVYGSIAKAEAAAGGIPSVLTEGGGHPVVISLRKVIPREGN